MLHGKWGDYWRLGAFAEPKATQTLNLKNREEKGKERKCKSVV